MHRDPLPTTRRGFLTFAGTGAALTALGGLRPGAALADAARSGAGQARFFGDREQELLALVVERMVASDEPAAPALVETRTLATSPSRASAA